MLGIVKLILLALLVSISAQCADPRATVGSEEARHHLIGRLPPIRDARRVRTLESVLVELTVDATGQVANAEALDSPRFADRAVAIAKALRFRPFLRNGVPVDALLDEHIPVLPPEKLPTRHAAFPEVTDLSAVTFSLRRTDCLGSCPVYEVSIAGDGLVTYSGRAFIAVTGTHTDHIPIEKVRELLEAFRKADFYSLADEYSLRVTDGPTYIVGLQIGGHAKKVIDYMGTYAGMPAVVSDLEQQLDAISGDEKWLKGNSDTVASLRKEGFDFSSDAATLMLTRVAASGEEQAVLDLINAGAPIGAVEMKDATALSNAAASGKLRAVSLLIERGADPKQPFVLREAARSGSPAVLRRILQAGANAKSDLPGVRFLLFDATSIMGRTGDDVDRGAVVRLLVEAGADPNVRDPNHNIPLHGDIDPDAARALIAAGADVNARNKDGETPLMWTSSEFVAEILLNAGADVSIRAKGKTALDTLHGAHKAKIVALIEKAAQSQKSPALQR